MRSIGAGAPLVVGAIDAGSNALRAAIARVDPGGAVHLLHRARVPVRLGRGVFTDGCLGGATIEDAVLAFERFAALFRDAGATSVRAVGTSALREARDGGRLIDAIRGRTGVVVTPIAAAAEAALVRRAVARAFPADLPPEMIADLGGGSLELSVLYRGAPVTAVDLPLGTVRLLETRRLAGPIRTSAALGLDAHVRATLAAALPAAPGPGARVALCGGNPRALARLFPAAPWLGLPVLDVDLLAAALPAMCELPVDARAAAYEIDRERAEVIAIASLVIVALVGWMGASRVVVPGVGVLDGLIDELAEELRRPVGRAT
jgi:exopolyphosphatase/guanosine-5'-triphosphate,3'-diphosphate pyrophosphatase